MMRFLIFMTLGTMLLNSTNGFSQSTNSKELHIQIYDQGIPYSLEKSAKYNSTRNFENKSVFQSSVYNSTIYVEISSKDTADLKPSSNHALKANSLKFNPNLDYELVVYKYNGFDRADPDLMTIEVSKLKHNAQLIIPFKKGRFKLADLKYFKILDLEEQPNFKSITKGKELNNNLKLDSTSFFSNGSIQTEYYLVSENFPVYYVKEYDSINETRYSQGFRLLTNYKLKTEPTYNPIWSNSENTKYGYWEYFENNTCYKHELWKSALSHQFLWFPNGNLKSFIDFGRTDNKTKYQLFLENGSIKEESEQINQTRRYHIRSYIYSEFGKVIQMNTYDSENGYTKLGLVERAVYYPSGELKMEETFGKYYHIKNYNKNGTSKIK